LDLLPSRLVAKNNLTILLTRITVSAGVSADSGCDPNDFNPDFVFSFAPRQGMSAAFILKGRIYV